MTTASNDFITNTTLSPEEEDGGVSFTLAVVTILVMCVAIVMAVGGNLLVLLSYCRDPLLRDVHNLYLLHLAICDLLIGAISMPIYLVYTVRRWNWPLGVAACKMYLAMNYTVTTMTTVAVILVAWDNLALLRYGAAYPEVETRRKAYLRLGVGWLFSFLLYSPVILLWDVVTGVSVVPSDECDTEYNQHLGYNIFAESINFFVPFVSLCVLHVLIFMGLRQRLRGSPKVLSVRQPRTVSFADSVLTSSIKPTTSSYQPASNHEERRIVGIIKLPSGQTASISEEQRTSAVGEPNKTVDRTMSSCTDNWIYTKPKLRASKSADMGISSVYAPHETFENQENKDNLPRLHISSPESGFKLSAIATTCMEAILQEIGAQVNLNTVCLLANRSPVRSYNTDTVSHLSFDTDSTPSDLATTHNISMSVNNCGRPNTSMSANRTNIEKCPGAREESRPRTDVIESSLVETSTTATRTMTRERPQSFATKNMNTRIFVVLTGLVLAMAICWLPWCVATVLRAACQKCVNKDLHKFFTWLLWFKSCLNPLLYAYGSPRFRLNIRQLLMRVCPRVLCRITSSRKSTWTQRKRTSDDLSSLANCN